MKILFFQQLLPEKQAHFFQVSFPGTGRSIKDPHGPSGRKVLFFLIQCGQISFGNIPEIRDTAFFKFLPFSDSQIFFAGLLINDSDLIKSDGPGIGIAGLFVFDFPGIFKRFIIFFLAAAAHW